MSEMVVPDRWTQVDLESIIESAVDGPFGSNLKSEHYVDQPGVRVIRLQNIGISRFLDNDRAYVSSAHAATLSRHSVRSGDLLVASLGDAAHPVARACQYPDEIGPAIVKADCFRLRVDTAKAHHEFVRWLLNSESARAALLQRAHGVTRDRVNLTSLRGLRITLPPLPEQRKIAEILDTVDKSIRSTERLIAKLDTVRRELIASQLDRTREHFRLADSAKVTVGYVGPTAEFYTSANRGIPFFRTGDITEDGLRTADIKYVTPEFHRRNQKSALNSGDVVVSRVGYTGIAAVVPDMESANCANMIIIRAGHFLDPEFVSLIFGTRQMIGQVERFTAGSAQPVLNIRLVEKLMVPSLHIDHQRKIVRLARSSVASMATYRSELAKLREVKQGLMEDLLTGRVRVKVD